MEYIKALHIIFVVTWFAGLFYLVRLFIYHREAKGEEGEEFLIPKFMIMERRLWYGITWPSAILAMVLGLILMGDYWPLKNNPWIIVKLILVAFLFLYHLSCGVIGQRMRRGIYPFSSGVLRLWNEVATLFLVSIVFLVVCKDTLDMVKGIGVLFLLALVLFTASKLYRKKKADDKTRGDISPHLVAIGPSNSWDSIDWKSKDLTYWKKVLPPTVYHITREGGTESSFSGKFVHWEKEGLFLCSNCGQKLFSSKTKFNSKSGWPSFWESLDQTKVVEREDRSFGMVRREIICSRCHAHLGHLFNDGPPPTNLRYCINSLALNFMPLN